MKTKHKKIKTAAICTLLTAAVLVCQVQCKADDKAVESTEKPPVEQAIKTVPAETVAFFNVPLDYSIQSYITQICEEHHIDPAVVVAMINVESRYDIEAIGDNGHAFGLMQVQTRWHHARMDKLGATNLLDPYQNIAVGVDYLAELIDYYDGNLEKALIAYNAGQLGAYNMYFSCGVYSNKYSKAVLETVEELTEGMVVHVLQ